MAYILSRQVLDRGQNLEICCQKTCLRIPVDGVPIPSVGHTRIQPIVREEIYAIRCRLSSCGLTDVRD